MTDVYIFLSIHRFCVLWLRFIYNKSFVIQITKDINSNLIILQFNTYINTVIFYTLSNNYFINRLFIWFYAYVIKTFSKLFNPFYSKMIFKQTYVYCVMRRSYVEKIKEKILRRNNNNFPKFSQIFAIFRWLFAKYTCVLTYL